ncbi:glycosyltransferase [Oryzomonas sagensis]|uniref:Glycosyltransferase n=1 Tax=Oryzomonas sagensis TaxID=2603857 RepID=A0ABQ6TKB0_9BACT|nr:glycosyltransferase family 2 protein [Oryzomonas sagensis]KAB0668519.1 glycosyltransferase [Oryzomonas sagensis]
MELVSVIIPTYNGTRYLLQSVQSVLDQTYPRFEIIVVDDGSSQDIRSVLAPVSDRVIYLRQDNAGCGAARNLGLSAANGSYVAFIDDDDQWLPGNLESLVRTIEGEPNCALVYSYPSLIDEHGRDIVNERPSSMPSGDVYLEFLRRNRINTPSVTLLRKSCLVEAGLFNQDILCEDYELWLRIARKFRIVFCAEKLVCYRLRAGSLSKRYDEMLDGYVSIINSEIARSGDLVGLDKHRVRNAAKLNLNTIYRKYAFIYYYDVKDRKKAKSCLSKALKICPFDTRSIVYYLLCSLPQAVFEPVIKVKRLLTKWSS